MDEEMITLSIDDYTKLQNVLKNNADRICFKLCTSDKITIVPIKNNCITDKSITDKSITDKKEGNKSGVNIVEKWIRDIKDIASKGYSNAISSKEAFKSIQTYCEAVIISVTS